MKQEALALFPMPWLTVMGLILFLAVFLGIIFWTFKVSRRENLSATAHLALEESFEIENVKRGQP